MAARRCRPTGPVIPVVLDQLGNLKDVSKSLVLNNVAIADFRKTVICGIGEGGSIGSWFNAPVGILVDIDVLANVAPTGKRVGQQIEHLVILHRQAVRNPAWLPDRKDQVQTLIRPNSSMRIEVVTGRLGKAAVIVGNKGRHLSIGG